MFFFPLGENDLVHKLTLFLMDSSFMPNRIIKMLDTTGLLPSFISM